MKVPKLRTASTQKKAITQLEQETQKMQDKLEKLKKEMSQNKEISQKSSRWSANSSVSKQPVIGMILGLSILIDEKMESFLKEIKMESYMGKLVEMGFDELDVLMEIEGSHLEEMSMPKGHQIRLMKKIREYKNPYRELIESVPSSIIGQTKQSQSQQREKKSVRFQNEHKFGLFEQLEEISQYLKEQDEQDRLEQQNHSYMDQFSTQTDTQTDTPNYQQELSTQQQQQQQQQQLINQQQLRIRRNSCWNCYRLIAGDQGIVFEDRNFCCNGCVISYESLFKGICCGVEMDRRNGCKVVGCNRLLEVSQQQQMLQHEQIPQQPIPQQPIPQSPIPQTTTTEIDLDLNDIIL